MGWSPDSEDYRALTLSLPEKEDEYRLAAHLGLTVFDYDNDSEMTAEHKAHPGVMTYELDMPGAPADTPAAHMVYEPDLRTLRGIPPQYDQYNPKPVLILVDESQPPHDT